MGIIFTGGPNSVYDEKSPHIAKEIFEMGIPILGICYGCQLMAYTLGGKVATCTTSEYGKTETIYDKSSALFSSEELPEQAISWMSHTDYISEAPEGFTITAHTENCPVAAMENPERKLYAVQFHPEVKMLDGFLKNVCGCTGDWTMGNYAKTAIAQIREKVGDGRVLLALSGGVDSSVCAALLSRAVGKKLTCIFVDHGFLRKNEGDEVEAAFADKDINFIRVNAKAAFMEKLNGVSDPETKRKTIGEEFIRAFERESKKLGTVDFLAQGTIYPDVIESGTTTWAVCRIMWTFRKLSNRCGCCSRTRCVSWVSNWVCRKIWYGGSRSRVRGWRFVSSAKSPMKSCPFCRTLTGSSVRRSPRPDWIGAFTSTSQC